MSSAAAGGEPGVEGPVVEGPVVEEPVVEQVTRGAPALRPPVLMSQDWVDLTYLHWAVTPARVAPLMPPGVRPDVLGGRTWVGLVPFRLRRAALGRGPAVPWAGTFLETNVRLYSVDDTGRRGVVFRSLDAARLPVVLAARAAGLPYVWARMRWEARVRDGAVEHAYTARRRWPGPRGATSRVHVRIGDAMAPDDEDAGLADFLTARWGLHVARAGRTWYVPNEHEPWPLRRAELLHLSDGLLAAAGFADLASRPPDHVAYSPGVHSVFGLPVDARRPRG